MQLSLFSFLSKTIQTIQILKIHFDNSLSSSILLVLEAELELEPCSIKCPGFRKIHMNTLNRYLNLSVFALRDYHQNASCFKWYVVLKLKEPLSGIYGQKSNSC